MVGGQPLLIVGVAEPIVLTYAYMFRFARDKPDLGERRLPPPLPRPRVGGGVTNVQSGGGGSATVFEMDADGASLKSSLPTSS